MLTFDYYRVKPGETLSKIAKRYDSDVRRIARANNLNKSNFIVAGKKLKIPRGLYPLELEQYELAIEEQAYPFEEKAIDVHESNLKLISRGVYNVWIEKSLQKLAEFVPARYDKPEETSGIISSLETYIFEIDRPAPTVAPESEYAEPATGRRTRVSYGFRIRRSCDRSKNSDLSQSVRTRGTCTGRRIRVCHGVRNQGVYTGRRTRAS